MAPNTRDIKNQAERIANGQTGASKQELAQMIRDLAERVESLEKRRSAAGAADPRQASH